MDIHFVAKDPMGRVISCSTEKWYDHILPHRKWLEDAGWETNVKDAIENASFITKDKEYPDRECFYKQPGELAAYMKVVVEFSGSSGRVVTAIETSSVKKGEVVIWSK